MEPQNQPMATSAAPKIADTGVKSYINMVTLAFFAGQLGLARAYRGERVGWVRFWLYIGSTVLLIVPFINILAMLALLVLAIWGLIDFFLIYDLTTDANGQPLHATERDKNWAKTMRILYIVGIVLVILIFVLGFIFASVIANNLSNSYQNITPSSFRVR